MRSELKHIRFPRFVCRNLFHPICALCPLTCAFNFLEFAIWNLLSISEN